MNEKRNIKEIVEGFDWDEVEGVPLKKAIEYLSDLAKTLPDNAFLSEEWTGGGYEDM